MEQINIDPAEFSIVPNTGKDMTAAFRALFNRLKETEGDKKVTFEAGVYDFYPEFAERKIYYISNTVSKTEMRIPMRTVPLRLSDCENATIEGEGAVFLMHGSMTNFVAERSKNIVLKGVAFDCADPFCFEAEIAEKKGFKAIFRFADDCKYKTVRGRPVFYGPNFEYNPLKNINFQWQNVRFSADAPDRIDRAKNPFAGAVRFKDLGKNLLEVTYFGAPYFSEGDRFAIIPMRREEMGIFVDRCENVRFDGVKEYFNGSHAYIAQVSKNIALENCVNAPKKDSGKFLASVTDFCHFAMCSGKVSVKNCCFSGASDDVINVHGFHFKVLKAEADTLTIRFMHRQAYGYLPFEAGDEIELIRRDTLVPSGKKAVVQSAKMKDLYRIELLLDRNIEAELFRGAMVENLTKCAELEFVKNRMNMVTTRGVLVTTRGKVLIENNDFYKLGMSGVLIADDARSWFESGGVRDVTIKNNRFVELKGQAVRIAPEYSRYDGAVHKNIKIENNEMISNGAAIFVKGADGVLIKENVISGEPSKNGFIVTENSDVKLEKNNIKD